MSQLATIRHFFGSRSQADCAMDAREYKRGGNPANPGQFSKGGGASTSPAKPIPKRDASVQAHAAAKAKVAENAAKPKKAPAKPKKTNAEGSATPAKPKAVKTRSKTDAHVKEREKHLAKEAKAAQKPAPKEKAPAKPKKPTASERAEAVPKAETPAPKAATPNASWENYGKNGIRAKARASLLNQSSGKGWVAEEVDGSWTVHHDGSSEADEPKGHTQSHRAPSHEVIMGGGTHNKYSVREYGETVKTPDGTDKKFNTKAAAEKFVSGRKGTLKALSEGGKAEAPAPKKAPVPKAAAKPKAPSPKKYTGAKEHTDTEKQELQMRSDFSTIEAAANAVPQQLADAKGYSPDWRGLLQAVRNMKASPHLGAVGMESIRKASRGIKPVGAGEPNAAERNALLAALKKPKATKPKSEPSATKAAPKPKAPKKSTVAPNFGEAFTAKPGRRRGGTNPDLAS